MAKAGERIGQEEQQKFPDEQTLECEGAAEDFDDDQQYDQDDAIDNCGQVPGGGCLYIGSEYCDWSCPFSSEMFTNMNRKRDAQGRFCK